MHRKAVLHLQVKTPGTTGVVELKYYLSRVLDGDLLDGNNLQVLKIPTPFGVPAIAQETFSVFVDLDLGGYNPNDHAGLAIWRDARASNLNDTLPAQFDIAEAKFEGRRWR